MNVKTYIWAGCVVGITGCSLLLYTCNQNVDKLAQAGNVEVAPAREKATTTTVKKTTKTPDGKTVVEEKTVKEQDITKPSGVKAVLPKNKLTVGIVAPYRELLSQERVYELTYERRLFSSPVWVGVGGSTDGKVKLTIGAEL